MTSIIVPSRLLPNRQRDPLVKPTGQLEIDWSHPLTQGLFFCCVDGFTDLVTGKTAIYSTRDTTTYSGAFKSAGNCSIRTTSNTNKIYHAGVDTSIARTTFLCWYQTGGSESSSYPFSGDLSDGTAIRAGQFILTPTFFGTQHRGGTSTTYGRFNGDPDDFGLTSYHEKWHAVAYSHTCPTITSTDTARFVVDGRQYTVASTFTSGSSVTMTASGRVTVNGRGNDTTRDLTGAVSALMFWNVEMGFGQLHQLYRDPYQFLREVF